MVYKSSQPDTAYDSESEVFAYASELVEKDLEPVVLALLQVSKDRASSEEPVVQDDKL
jgi:hypothetical protein